MAKDDWKMEALEHALCIDLEQRKMPRTMWPAPLTSDPDVLAALHRRAERRKVKSRK